MGSRLVWECKGANGLVVNSKRIVLFVCAAFVVLDLIGLFFYLANRGWDEMVTLLLLCAVVLGVYGLIEGLQLVTMQNSYLRIFDDHVELLSTSHDALMKQSWQGVKASVRKEQILNLSTAGKKLVLETQGGTYEVFVPNVDEAESTMRKYLER